MAPKRKPRAAAPPPASTSTTARKPPRSKLAREHNLTADQETAVSEAFGLFATRGGPKEEEEEDEEGNSSSSGQYLARADVRRALIALGAPARDRAELREILEAVDPEEEGRVGFERFVAVAALKLQSRDTGAADDEEGQEGGGGGAEVAAAYALFTRGEQRAIGLADLRRVARELREEVPEEVLRDMLREATGGEVRGVGREEFEGVMRRAGAFA